MAEGRFPPSPVGMPLPNPTWRPCTLSSGPPPRCGTPRDKRARRQVGRFVFEEWRNQGPPQPRRGRTDGGSGGRHGWRKGAERRVGPGAIVLDILSKVLQNRLIQIGENCLPRAMNDAFFRAGRSHRVEHGCAMRRTEAAYLLATIPARPQPDPSSTTCLDVRARL